MTGTMSHRILTGLAVMAITLGVLSGFALIRRGFHIELALPLAWLLDAYHAGVEFAVGLIEPAVRLVLEVPRFVTQRDMPLYPHWKHSLVAFSGLGSAVTRSLVRDAMSINALVIVAGAAAVGLWGGLMPLEPDLGLRGWRYTTVLIGLAMLLIAGAMFVASRRAASAQNAASALRLRTIAVNFAAVPGGVVALVLLNMVLRLIPGL